MAVWPCPRPAPVLRRPTAAVGRIGWLWQIQSGRWAYETTPAQPPGGLWPSPWPAPSQHHLLLVSASREPCPVPAALRLLPGPGQPGHTDLQGPSGDAEWKRCLPPSTSSSLCSPAGMVLGARHPPRSSAMDVAETPPSFAVALSVH